MQKIYLSVLLLLLCFLTQAQPLMATHGDSAQTTFTVVDGFEPVDIHLTLHNNSNSAITITWGLESNIAPQEWGLGVCDNNNCYDMLFSPGPYVSLSIAAHDTIDMKLQYTSHCKAGTGTARVYAYVTGDSANSVVHLNYKANLGASCETGINGVNLSPLKIYPNPSTGSFVVSGLEDAGNVSFEVYDMKGAAVKSEVKGITDSQLEISLQNQPKGNYIFRVFDADGKVIGSSRLSKLD